MRAILTVPWWMYWKTPPARTTLWCISLRGVGPPWVRHPPHQPLAPPLSRFPRYPRHLLTSTLNTFQVCLNTSCLSRWGNLFRLLCPIRFRPCLLKAHKRLLILVVSTSHQTTTLRTLLLPSTTGLRWAEIVLISAHKSFNLQSFKLRFDSPLTLNRSFFVIWTMQPDYRRIQSLLLFPTLESDWNGKSFQSYFTCASGILSGNLSSEFIFLEQLI